jgi:hypothetical protein
VIGRDGTLGIPDLTSVTKPIINPLKKRNLPVLAKKFQRTSDKARNELRSLKSSESMKIPAKGDMPRQDFTIYQSAQILDQDIGECNENNEQNQSVVVESVTPGKLSVYVLALNVVASSKRNQYMLMKENCRMTPKFQN